MESSQHIHSQKKLHRIPLCTLHRTRTFKYNDHYTLFSIQPQVVRFYTSHSGTELCFLTIHAKNQIFVYIYNVDRRVYQFHDPSRSHHLTIHLLPKEHAFSSFIFFSLLLKLRLKKPHRASETAMNGIREGAISDRRNQGHNSRAIHPELCTIVLTYSYVFLCAVAVQIVLYVVYRFECQRKGKGVQRKTKEVTAKTGK